MLSRRELVIAGAVLPAANLTSTLLVSAAAAQTRFFAVLEAKHGGHLGVAAIDLGSGRRMAWRAGERFPMCSTFKLLLVALVLQRVDAGKERLDRRVAYDASLFPNTDFYAPVTRAHLHDGGLSVEALCAAAIEWSDNGAANLLIASVGGPSAVTAFARSLHDPVTRLDHIEPAMNVWRPGDLENTTTPGAMVRDLNAVLFDRRVLREASAQRLTNWLAQCKTAAARIPAGLPAGWRSGNKTGSWPENGSTNDVAILWPPHAKPILVAAYYTGSKAPSAVREAVLADVGRIVSQAFWTARVAP
jgi:beta-lactamase class A